MNDIDLLQLGLFQKRIGGSVFGGKRIAWTPQDQGVIKDYIFSLPKDVLAHSHAGPPNDDSNATATTAASAKPTDRKFNFRISREMVDREGDLIKVAGIDASSFNNNAPVLDSHDSTKLPIATSSMPYVLGDAMYAEATFPASGISRNSDRVASAVRSGLIRACSIGFIPLKWSFSKDPNRPTGIDFHNCSLIEWSICAIPACPDALLIGPVTDTSKAVGDHLDAAARLDEWRRQKRRAEAEALTASVRRLK
jgi:hypothetical protein